MSYDTSKFHVSGIAHNTDWQYITIAENISPKFHMTNVALYHFSNLGKILLPTHSKIRLLSACIALNSALPQFIIVVEKIRCKEQNMVFSSIA